MSTSLVPDSERLAKLCFQTFESIPKTGKPILGKEWTVLSCIAKYEHQTNQMEIVSMGTGTRCIGRSSMCTKGGKLNDSHAEVMCRRGFLLYLYNEISKWIEETGISIFSFNENKKKFTVPSNISFHFVSTFAPCGDASIFCIEKSGDKRSGGEGSNQSKRPKLEQDWLDKLNDTTTNVTGAKLIYKSTEVFQDLMAQTIGAIRSKPGRGEPTLSISCSDKLAKWNVLGLQGALIYSLLDKPIYYNSMTFCDPEHCNTTAAKRAIWGRFSSRNFYPSHPFIVNQPVIQMAESKFKYEKNINLQPAPGSIIWSKVNNGLQQVSVNGELQGATKKRPGRLKTSKIEFFRCYIDILKKIDDKLNIFDSNMDFDSLKYCDAKGKSNEYQQVWTSLKKEYFNIWTTKPPELNTFTI